MAYVVTSMRLDAETVLAAPIHLHNQVTPVSTPQDYLSLNLLLTSLHH